jgi:hypothetical protein
MLIFVVVLLALSPFLPWWSETETGQGFPPSTSTQNFSPLNGVTGVCSPSCSTIFTGPPTGPVQGTKSFSQLKLNQTGELYEVTFAFVIVGLISSVLTLVTGWTRAGGTVSARRARIHGWLLNAALAATALGSVLLAWAQPAALRSDAAGFSGPGAWTPSPSPETSFWGGCSPGPSNGICASGWSVSWGPGLGWDLTTLALLVLAVVQVLRILRFREQSVAAPTSR